MHSRRLPVAWWTMPAKTMWQEGQWSMVERVRETIIPSLGKAEWLPCSRSVRREDGMLSCECDRNRRVVARWAGSGVEHGLALTPSSVTQEIVGRDVPSCGKKSHSRPM